MNNLSYSKNGLHLTELFEGDVLHAYKNTNDVWTIGYGHTGPDVHEGLVWTQQQADAALMKDIFWATRVVNALVTASLTQNEFDALVDFVFNVGVGNFKNSTLLSLLNKGDFEGAAAEFTKWSHLGGVQVAGLLRRRLAETQEFQNA